MKYYQLTINHEPKILGVTDGLYQGTLKKNNSLDFDKHFNYKNINFWDEQSKVKLLSKPELNFMPFKKTIFTDIMLYTPHQYGFEYMYSLKYIQIIEKFILNEFTSFKVNVFKQIFSYYLFYVKKVLFSELLFSESLFYTGQHFNNDIRCLNFKSYSEYLKYKDSDNSESTNYKQLCIPKLYENLDIISIRGIDGLFYSENVVDEIINNSLTGFHINEKITLTFN